MSNSISRSHSQSELIPVDLTEMLPTMQEPMRSIFSAQLSVINALENPGLIEVQTDLILAHLDEAAISAQSNDVGKIARTGSLLITYQLFIASSFVLFQQNKNRQLLINAIDEFASKLAVDICTSAAEAGKTLNPITVSSSILDAFKKRIQEDGNKFFSRIIKFISDKSKATTAKNSYLDATVRVAGKVSRRRYFNRNGQHLRSEERRVGKECSEPCKYQREAEQLKKKTRTQKDEASN